MKLLLIVASIYLILTIINFILFFSIIIYIAIKFKKEDINILEEIAKNSGEITKQRKLLLTINMFFMPVRREISLYFILQILLKKFDKIKGYINTKKSN